MNVLDLFSGIGGFSLGLERAGMRTVAFCEANPHARAVLAKHWPNVPCYPDVRELTAARLRADGIVADVICGGFPCQDISTAGYGAGITGERSGLWKEYARIIGEIRPSHVIVENVSALLSRGLGVVLGDLAALGYDAEWHCIPASAVGAPHRRDRIWILADAQHDGREQQGCCHMEAGSRSSCGQGREQATSLSRCCKDVADANSLRELQPEGRIRNVWGRISNSGWWSTEPNVGRMAYGVPSRVDRLERLGNAVVPQIPEIIGRAIMSASTVNSQHHSTEGEK